MAESSKPPEIPEPTENDLRRIAHADQLPRFNDPQVREDLRQEWYARRGGVAPSRDRPKRPYEPPEENLHEAERENQRTKRELEAHQQKASGQSLPSQNPMDGVIPALRAGKPEPEIANRELVDPDLLYFSTGEERKWLQEHSLSAEDEKTLLADLQSKLDAWRAELKPTKEDLLRHTTDENRQHVRFGRDTPELWEQMEKDWRRNQHPFRGVRVPSSGRSFSPQEIRRSKLLRFMPPQLRAEYDKADPKRKAALWEANEQNFEAASKREEERIRRYKEKTEKAMDMLHQLREDPSKSDLLPPDDASMDELHKWYDEMSKPVRTIPFPGSANGGEGTNYREQPAYARFRSAITGRYVSKGEAKRRKHVVREEKAKPGAKPDPRVAGTLQQPPDPSAPRRRSLTDELADHFPPTQQQQSPSDVGEFHTNANGKVELRHGKRNERKHSFPSAVWKEIKRNKGWYFLAFLLGGLPVGIATIWPTLTRETIPDWLTKHGLPKLGTLVIGWVAVALIIALVIVVRSCLRVIADSKQDVDQN